MSLHAPRRCITSRLLRGCCATLDASWATHWWPRAGGIQTLLSGHSARVSSRKPRCAQSWMSSGSCGARSQMLRQQPLLQ